MPTRVLILGGGGREHALAWKLASEPGVNEVVVAPGSAAIGMEPRVRVMADVDPLNAAAVVEVARQVVAELVVIGPEAPLEAGVGDALRAAGFAVFGPDRAAARIETSKSFCHDIAEAAGVRMARSGAFADLGEAIGFARMLAAAGDGLVVKADGLAAGKGVHVCDNLESAEAAIEALAGDAVGRGVAAGVFVVIEERLRGPEASVIGLADGRDVVGLPVARDHKQLLDRDKGPNTGGMGAYSPVGDVPETEIAGLLEQFHRPIIAELRRRGTPFIGALYAGLMLTADGPVLLECNARFGDPEAQVLVPRIATPLGPVLLAAARGTLADAVVRMGIRGPLLPTLPGATVGVVIAAAGYPDAPRRGDAIAGLDEATAAGHLVFHAGTASDGSGGYVTDGGRIVTVVARGRDLDEAAERADAAADLVRFPGSQRRRDIGRRTVAPGSDRDAAMDSGTTPAHAGAR